jgi:tRNA(fMet)-specific endonuclease VapC
LVHVADARVVIDTDLVVDFLRGHDPGRSFVRSAIRSRRARFTTVSAFELRLGRDFEERRDRLASLLSRRTISLDLRSALLAGEIHRSLLVEGRPIGVSDAMIAGICRRHELPLATRNVRHFERVPGLRLVTV